jgi:neutral ceramidase
MAPRLQAGVARAVTTPPVGITHASWGAQTHTRAEGVDLDLWATALVLSDGQTEAAIVDVDLGGFPNDLVKTIRERIESLTGIPGAHVRLSASHTHSGGNVSPAWFPDGGEMIPGYLASLTDRVVGAVWEAKRALKPARVAAGFGHSTVAMNRRMWHPEQKRVVLGRNRAGFADHEMPVARIDDAAEQPIAILVNYGCHPTIMAHGNSLITPDYPGPLRRTVEANVGGRCLFLQGATGDRHSKESFLSQRDGYRRVGKLLGLEAAKVALDLETLPKQERLVEVLESGAELGIYADDPGPEPDGTLRVANTVVELPLKELGDPDALEAERERASSALQAALTRGDPAEIRSLGYQAKRTGMLANQARRNHGRTTLSLPIQAMRIGALALVAMPAEPFAEIGVQIRRGSPFAVTMVSGYSNGQGAYIPMRSDYANGGYGVWNSPVGPGSAEAVVDASLRLLKELR